MTESTSGEASPVSDDTPPTSRIVFGKYALGRLLGRGASAKVYHARHLSSGHALAVKVFPNPRRPSAPSPDSFIREISALRRLHHHHIIRLQEVLASRSKVYLVLELAKGGELFSRIDECGRLAEDLSCRLFRQLISAVAYSHSRGVFHRDLKPENLLLDEAGNLKVSDFGFSALRFSSEGCAHGSPLLQTQCGTPAYVAPEILSGKQTGGYDGAKADIWSCGVILFVLNAGYLPFNDPNLMALYRKIYRGHHRCPRWTSPDLRRLVASLLDPNPATRVSIDGILRDPWFSKGLDADQKASLMRPLEVDSKPYRCQDGDLNAFDLISFSSGLNLSGFLTEETSDLEWFAVDEPAGRVAERVEQVAKGEGFAVKREGNKGTTMVVKGQNGEFIVRVEVHQLIDRVAVVEAEMAGAGAGRFWNEKMRPALSVVDRVTDLPNSAATGKEKVYSRHIPRNKRSII